MYGHGSAFRAKSTVCPCLLIKWLILNRLSADNNISLSHSSQYRGTARLISDLMNPLVIPPAVLIITSWMAGLSGYNIGSVAVVALFFYLLIPLSLGFYLLRKKRIASLDLPSRKARNPLYAYSIISALAACLCFAFTPELNHPLLMMITIVYLINLMIGFLINLRWKMSVHTAALASSGAIFLYSYYLSSSSPLLATEILSLTILLVLLPLMIWARYRLRIHSLPELFGGVVTGFLLTIVELLLLNNLW